MLNHWQTNQQRSVNIGRATHTVQILVTDSRRQPRYSNILLASGCVLPISLFASMETQVAKLIFQAPPSITLHSFFHLLTVVTLKGSKTKTPHPFA